MFAHWTHFNSFAARYFERMKSDKPTTNDGCPTWAVDMISKILLLEVEAGTIKNISESAAREGWSTTKADELMKIAAKMDKNESDASTQKDLSAEVEAIFSKVTRGLAREGHSAETIAAMINSRIPTGCRLPYCNADEVQAALD
jgi:hypothetical protein